MGAVAEQRGRVIAEVHADHLPEPATTAGLDTGQRILEQGPAARGDVQAPRGL